MKSYIKYYVLIILLLSITTLKPIMWPYWFEKNVGCVIHPIKAFRTALDQSIVSFHASEKEYPGTLSFFVNLYTAVNNFSIFAYEYCSFNSMKELEEHAEEIGRSYFIRNIWKILGLSLIVRYKAADFTTRNNQYNVIVYK